MRIRDVKNKLLSEWLVQKSKGRRFELFNDIGQHQERQGIPDKAITKCYHQLAGDASVHVEFLTQQQLSLLTSGSGKSSPVPSSGQTESDREESGAEPDEVLTVVKVDCSTRYLDDDEESIEIALSDDNYTYEIISEDEGASKPENVKQIEKENEFPKESSSQNTGQRLESVVQNEEENKLENVLLNKEQKQTSVLENEEKQRHTPECVFQNKHELNHGSALQKEDINKSDLLQNKDENKPIVNVEKGAKTLEVTTSEIDGDRVVETVPNANGLLNTGNSSKEDSVKSNETEIKAQSENKVPLKPNEHKSGVFRVKENTKISCQLQTNEQTEKCNVIKEQNVKGFRNNDGCESSKSCENYEALQEKKTNDNMIVELQKLQEIIAKQLKSKNVFVPFKLEDNKCKSTVKSNLKNIGEINVSEELFDKTNIEKDKSSCNSNVLGNGSVGSAVLISKNKEWSLPTLNIKKSLDTLNNTDLNPCLKNLNAHKKPLSSEHNVGKCSDSENVTGFELIDMECGDLEDSEKRLIKNTGETATNKLEKGRIDQDLMSKFEDNLKQFSTQVKSLDEHLTAKKRALDIAPVEVARKRRASEQSSRSNKTLETLKKPNNTLSDPDPPLLGTAKDSCKNQNSTNRQESQLSLSSVKELQINSSSNQTTSASKSRRYSADVAQVKNVHQNSVKINLSIVIPSTQTTSSHVANQDDCVGHSSDLTSVRAVNNLLSDNTVTSSTSGEYGAQSTAEDSSRKPLEVNQSNSLNSEMLVESPALLNALQSRADEGVRSQTVRTVPARLSTCLPIRGRLIVDNAVNLFLRYFETHGNELNCIPEMFHLNIFQFLKKRNTILLSISTKETMRVYLTLYAFFYNESVNKKINKAAEILHLAIADFNRKSERLNRASRLTSKSLRENEMKEAETDYQGMLLLRGDIFKEYFEPLMLQFTECEYPMLVALYYRITLALMKIDKENISHIYTIRSLIARLLKTAKYQFSLACNSYFTQPSDAFIETYKFVKNSLVALCLAEFDQPEARDIIEFVNLHPISEQLKKMLCDVHASRERRRPNILTQSGANRANPSEQRTSADFTSMLHRVAAQQQSKLQSIATNSASSGSVNHFNVGTRIANNSQTSTPVRMMPRDYSREQRIPLISGNQTFSHRQNTQAQHRPQATVNSPLLQKMIQKPPQHERLTHTIGNLNQQHQLPQRSGVSVASRNEGVDPNMVNKNQTQAYSLQSPGSQRMSWTDQQWRPVSATITHPVDSCTSDGGQPAAPLEVRACCNTGCTEPSTVLCSICKTATYCNKKCQANDWYQKHSTICLGGI